MVPLRSPASMMLCSGMADKALLSNTWMSSEVQYNEQAYCWIHVQGTTARVCICSLSKLFCVQGRLHEQQPTNHNEPDHMYC